MSFGRTPTVPCACAAAGCIFERRLDNLLEPMRPGSVHTVGKRMGIPGLDALPPSRGYWGMNHPPDIIYQAQGWGLRARGDDPPTSDRFRFMRVRPLGRAYLNQARAQYAQTVAEKYGLDVVVGSAPGWDWLDEVNEAEAGKIVESVTSPVASVDRVGD